MGLSRRVRQLGILVLVLGGNVACGSDDASGGGGGTSSGGTGAGNTGGSNTGGANTGGSNTGGSNTGGANTGGTNTGGTGNVGEPDPIILEDFSDLRTQAALPTPESPPQPLWYPVFESSNPVVSNSVLSVSAEGAPQIYFRPVDDNGWYFIRALIESGTWSDKGFNRMRFSVKQPNGVEPSGPGQHNVEWASFLHVGSATEDGPWNGSDDHNWHFYHFFEIPSDGLWYQVIIDTYPDHQRTEGGDVEQGDQEIPQIEDETNPPINTEFNYFSMMSSFYWDLPGQTTTGTVEFGPYSLFYEDNAGVPLAQVRSLNGAFDASTNTIKVGWMRRKDQSGHAYNVSWSYSPITDFAAATPAGSVTSPDTDSYNGVHFEFSEPDFANHPLVYIAIQPEDSTQFRQFYIPLK